MFCLWPANIWQQRPSNINNLYCLTQCFTKELQRRGTRDKSQVLLLLSILCRWESTGLLNDLSSLLFKDRNKSPHYYILQYILSRLSSLPLIPLSITPKANSTTGAQLKTVQLNFQIETALAQKWGISLNTEDVSSLTKTPILPTLAVSYSTVIETL